VLKSQLTSANGFTAPRQSDGLTNAYSGFSRYTDADMQLHRNNEQNSSLWGDAGSVHSPTDDRRSISNSEYFVSSSNTPSRSGSLPPSRHGAESLHNSQAAEALRYPQMQQPARTHNPSFSSQPGGRLYQERSGSVHSESLAMLRELNLESEPNLNSYKQSPHNNVASVYEQLSQFDPSAEGHHGMHRFEDSTANGDSLYSSNIAQNGLHNDTAAQLRAFQFNPRGAITPSGNSFRQSPYQSHAATPPTFDHLNPARSEQHIRPNTRAQSVNPALLDQKLQYLNYQQQEQRLVAAQYPNVYAASNPRLNSYPYYAVPNIMHMSGLHPNLAIQGLPGPFGPYVEIPSGPRNEDPEGVRSKCLTEFKANSKTNKKYELKVYVAATV
jgi:mRNA-binding protein PUF3